MNNPYKGSRIRLLAGCALLAAAGVVAVFVLPDASQRRIRTARASEETRNILKQQSDKLAVLQKEDGRLARSRQRLDALLASMPGRTTGELQWELSRRLYTLARQYGVRLHALKYGAPSREGVKGTDLEILDVEFTASGIYQNLKPFMLHLEDSRETPLPFAVAGAKLEESPDGARLSITLRAFRRTARREEAAP